MKSRDLRSERRVPIDILLNKYIESEPFVCHGLNLSQGGMLLRKICEPEMPFGEVSLEFQLPGSPRVLRADGVVLGGDAAERTHAVRFIRMAEEDRELISRYLRGEQLDDAVAL